jgi:flagellar biogenesis protein FliO
LCSVLVLASLVLVAVTGDARAQTEPAEPGPLAPRVEDWSLWNQSAGEPAAAETGTTPLWMAGRVILAVTLVAGLAVALLVCLKRFGVTRGASGIGAARLEMLASLALGPRRTVYLVRADGVELLLGTTGEGLGLLTELPGARDAQIAPPPAAGAAARSIPLDASGDGGAVGAGARARSAATSLHAGSVPVATGGPSFLAALNEFLGQPPPPSGRPGARR